MKSSDKKQTGFTLIEMMMAIFFFTVLMGGVIFLLDSIFANSNQQLLSVSNIDSARMASSSFTDEMRNAATGNDGSYPLSQAEDSQIVFYSTSKSNSSVVNRIHYYIMGNTLYEEIVTPTGSPLSYDLVPKSQKRFRQDWPMKAIPFSIIIRVFTTVRQVRLPSLLTSTRLNS